jgi:hypothetical protein
MSYCSIWLAFTLPLYLITPENRLKKAFKAFKHGDFEGSKALTDIYERVQCKCAARIID